MRRPARSSSRDHGGRVALVEHVEQQPVGEPAGRAVQGAFEHAEPGGDGRVGVRAGRGGDPHRERRGGEVVVDEQAECRVQHAQRGLVRRAVRSAVPTAAGPAGPRRGGVRRTGGRAATRVGMRVRAVPRTASSDRSKRSGSAAAAAIAATRNRSVGPVCSGSASTARRAAATDASGAVNTTPGAAGRSTATRRPPRRSGGRPVRWRRRPGSSTGPGR